MEMIILVLCFICIILLTVLIFLLARPRNESLRRDLNDANSRLREDILRSQAQTRNEVSGSIHTSVSSLGQLLNRNQQAFAEQQEYRLRSFEEGSEQRLEAIRETMERRISSMTAENNERPDQMRQIVERDRARAKAMGERIRAAQVESEAEKYLKEHPGEFTPGKTLAGWTDNFTAAVGKAKAEKKPILALFTGSDWCPPCQQLEKNILLQPCRRTG